MSGRSERSAISAVLTVGFIPVDLVVAYFGLRSQLSWGEILVRMIVTSAVRLPVLYALVWLYERGSRSRINAVYFWLYRLGLVVVAPVMPFLLIVTSVAIYSLKHVASR